MSDAYTYTEDSRPRREVRIDFEGRGQTIAVSVDEPTPAQVSEVLAMFMWAVRPSAPEGTTT